MLNIAIIGRPNVGKSTLFNRLVGRRIAIVDDTPGVTRDRRVGSAKLGDLEFLLTDTAGLEEAVLDSLAGRMTAQTNAAIDDADLCLFLIDARAGINPADEHFAKLLRQSGKPIVLVANKSEGQLGEAGFYDAFRLGLDQPVAVSAEHGQGLSELYSAIVDHPAAKSILSQEVVFETDEEGGPTHIAVVGRPNTGKSTFINRLLDEDRLLTGPEAGLTRDSIAIDWRWNDRDVRLFDTAGMRRKARVQQKLEKLSVSDTLRAIQFAHIVVIMIDATQPFEKQDLQIADLVSKEGRACVFAINKWDLVKDKNEVLKELKLEATRLLPQLRGIPIVPISALTGKGTNSVLTAVFAMYDIWNIRLATSKLNQWFEGILNHHPPPAVSGRRIKLRFITQVNNRPPSFFVSCSQPDKLPTAYIRYLINALRDDFKLPGVPIRLFTRKSANPYDSKSKSG